MTSELSNVNSVSSMTSLEYNTINSETNLKNRTSVQHFIFIKCPKEIQEVSVSASNLSLWTVKLTDNKK